MDLSKIGTLISVDLPEISCKLSSLGFKYILIDLEHGYVSNRTILSIIASKEKECKILIRIKEISEAHIKHALDLGVDGIVAPRLESSDELKILIDYSYFPPVGKRSLGFTQSNNYGLEFKDYITKFKPLIIPQIESRQGLEMIQDIVTNNLLSGIFVGPYDLSMSLGLQGQFESREFKDSIENIKRACKEQDKYFCMFTTNKDVAIAEIRSGTDIVFLGLDVNLFLNSYVELIS
ncbi:MAG: hypothetical protein HOP11_14805 [Saprospiraceae bacterium]|nr:hypothetical protein [Saprospiraceae bacterium]